MQQQTLCFVKHFKQFLSVANCSLVRMMMEGGLKWWYGSWIMCCVWELFVLHTRGWVGGWVRVTRVELLFVLCTLDIWVSQWASADSRRWACSQTSQGRNCQFTKFSLLESLKVTVCLFISANVLLCFKQKLPERRQTYLKPSIFGGMQVSIKFSFTILNSQMFRLLHRVQTIAHSKISSSYSISSV